MKIAVQISVNNGNYLDYSDYVTDIDNIPFKCQNRDHTLQAQEVNLKLSDTITNIPNVGDPMSVTITLTDSWTDGQGVFFGYITTKDYSQNDHKWSFRVAVMLKKLQNFKVKYSVLHDTIVSRANGDPTKYIASDNFICPNIQVIHLIECLFAKAGILTYWGDTTKTTYIKNPQTGSNLVIVINGSNYLAKLEQLRIDENVLYAIGQGYASIHSEFDGAEGTNLIDCFDMIGYLLSAFGLSCTFYYNLGTFGYKIEVAEFTTPTISDDAIYSKEQDTSLKTGVQLKKAKYCIDRVKYNGIEQTALVEYDEVESSCPDNLYFLYSASVIGNNTAGYVLDSATCRYTPNLAWYKKRKSSENDVQTVKTTTDFNFVTTVKETSFDLKNRQTEITQENYI